MSESINFNNLFDANALHLSGECPWTFFAYPTSVADAEGLPPDDDAKNLLGYLQNRGISVSIWKFDLNDTTYFACRHHDLKNLNVAVLEFASEHQLEENF